MVSKISNGSITHQEIADVVEVPQPEAEDQAKKDQGTSESIKSSAGSASIASQAKGILNMEANLRRYSVERDLDQPDMASAKTYQHQSDQDIASVFRTETERKKP